MGRMGAIQIMNKYFYKEDNFMANVSYPYIYQIEVTERCNLKCPACLNSKLVNKQDIAIELIDHIIEHNYLRSTPYTEFQMSGEPTLHPDLSLIIDKIKSTGTMVGLSSNLVKVNTDLLNKLDCLTISFDVFDKELYEQSRFPFRWDAFLRNFEFMVEQINANVLVYIQLLKTSWTVAKYEESKELLNSHLNFLSKKYNKPLDNFIIRYVDDCFVEQRDTGESYTFKSNDVCLNPFLTVSIKADGTVVPCCFDFEKSIPLGNLYEQSLDEIWNENALQELRAAHCKQEGLPVKCQKCVYRSPIKLNSSFLSDLIKFKQGLK